MKNVSVASLLLVATLISIAGFLFQTISFSLDEWLSIKIFLPSGSSPIEPPEQNVTVSAKFGLWEIGVIWDNGTFTNTTSAKLFYSPGSWVEDAFYVEELRPDIIESVHQGLLSSEILVSIGTALCFFVAVGLTLHKFAPELEKSVIFLLGFAFLMLTAGTLCLAGSILYMNTTLDYCGKLVDSYKNQSSSANSTQVNGIVEYCDVSFINVISIVGGIVEILGWTFLVAAIFFRVSKSNKWERF